MEIWTSIVNVKVNSSWETHNPIKVNKSHGFCYPWGCKYFFFVKQCCLEATILQMLCNRVFKVQVQVYYATILPTTGLLHGLISAQIYWSGRSVAWIGEPRAFPPVALSYERLMLFTASPWTGVNSTSALWVDYTVLNIKAFLQFITRTMWKQFRSLM